MIPCQVIGRDFPRVIRLIVTTDCNFNCKFPDKDLMFCHKEGLYFKKQEQSLSDIVDISRIIRKCCGIDSVRLGGLEPTLRGDILDVVSALHGDGFRDISISTNGSDIIRLADGLKKAGLKRISISLHSLSRERYYKFTSMDCLNNVLEGIERSIECGLEVKINHILLNGYDDDFYSFIDFVEKNRITGKINVLLWTKANSNTFNEYYVSWAKFLPVIRKKTHHMIITKYTVPQKNRVEFYLYGGGKIEADIFFPKSASPMPMCRECEYSLVCQEGFLGCGVRVLPDLSLSPCLLGKSRMALERFIEIENDIGPRV